MVDNYEDSRDPAEIMKYLWFHVIFTGEVSCKGIQECTEVFDALVGVRHDESRHQLDRNVRCVSGVRIRVENCCGGGLVGKFCNNGIGSILFYPQHIMETQSHRTVLTIYWDYHRRLKKQSGQLAYQ